MNRVIMGICLGLALYATAALTAEPMKDPNLKPVGGIHAHPPVEMIEGTKICVRECKETTKTVYTTACREYCQPNVSIWSLFKKCCGLDTEDFAECGTVKTKKVLIKKKVPGEPKTVCVVKDLATIPVVQPVPARK